MNVRRCSGFPGFFQLRLTRLADYAVKAVIHLAIQEIGNRSTLTDISLSENIPQRFLAKVMQILSKAGRVKKLNEKGLWEVSQ